MRSLIAAIVFLVFGAERASWSSPVRFEARGPVCDPERVRDRVTKLVGNDPFDAAARSMVSITTDTERTLVIASIVFEDIDGKLRGPRVVRAKTCAELVEATAVIVAMALPNLRAESSEPTSAVDPVPSQQDAEPAPHATTNEAPAPTSTATVASVVATEAPIAPVRPGATMELVFAGSTTTASEIDEELIVGARWRRTTRSLTAEVHVDAPQDISLGATGRIRVFRSEASLSPCGHVGPFAGCLIAAIGTIRGSGTGLSSGRAAFTPLVSGGVRVTWERHVSARVEVRLHLDLSALVTRTRFDVDHMDVWSSSPFEGSAGIGILTRFL